ncbi:MAG: hypothetical protein HC802_17330, partial [Caldilineaceae bacterium]|nr:hypothetical protein [Caldilineaceae bacterium]
TPLALHHNSARIHGGGVYVREGNITVTNTAQIASNVAISGSGGGIYAITSTVVVDNGAITLNMARGDGGGIAAYRATLFAHNGTTLSANSVITGSGGGLHVQGNAAMLTDVTLGANAAKTGGGGAYIQTLTAHVKQANVTGNNGGSGPGGGLFVQADLADVDENQIRSNQTAGYGGGLHIANTGLIQLFGNTIESNTVRQDRTVLTTTLTEDAADQIVTTPPLPESVLSDVPKAGDVVERVTVSEGVGGGLFVAGSSGTFSNNVVIDNFSLAGEGGGLYVSSVEMTMVNNLIVRNHLNLSSSFASGLYVLNSDLTLIHNTIADNKNEDSSESAASVGLYVTKSDESSAVNLVNNIVSGHTTGMILLAGTSADMDSNLWANTALDWSGQGAFGSVLDNVVASDPEVVLDPLFVDAANGDYRIQRVSPAFDIGTDSAGVAVDLDGASRPSSFAPDAGAFEHHYDQGVYLEVASSPPFVNTGDSVEYIATVRNDSLVPLNNVALSFNLAAGHANLSISGGSCSGTGCTFSSLAVGQSEQVRLTAKIDAAPGADGLKTLESTVTVSGPFLESDTQDTFEVNIQNCRVVYNGVDKPTIQAAVDAVDTTDETDDIIRVNGAVAGPSRSTRT